MDRSNSARSTRTFSYFQQQKQKQAASHCSFWCCIVFTVFFACAVLLSCVAFVKFDSQHHIKLPSLNEYVQLSVLTADKFGPLKLVTSSPVPIKAQPSSLPRKRYAYAITITKDGFFQDGAAVLIYSIMKYSWNASYDISFIAFVHPNVTTSRPGLRQLGFHIIDVPVPINVSAIQFDFLREKINKNGCCGSAELIKLSSYRLLQYDKVIHLDADVIFLNPIHEVLELPQSLVYTTDPNMATFKGVDKMPVQGGFIVLKPSMEDYRGIIDTEMRYEFRKYRGWNSSHIGWFWGGMTVQGILPFYYNRVTTPNRSLIIDRCYYNTMADTENCTKQTLDELKSAHFTVCQKPWGCWKSVGIPLCDKLHKRWFQLRAEAENFYGIADPISQACLGAGHAKYYKMLLARAKVDKNGPMGYLLKNVVPDDSPNRMDPIMPESRYIFNHYD